MTQRRYQLDPLTGMGDQPLNRAALIIAIVVTLFGVVVTRCRR